jgi:hypothetical protein
MSTRSLTFVYSESKRGEKATPIINMYRQYDGYPSGHGVELAEFLSDGKIINGISAGAKGKLFNGMGDLAAQMVAHFKKGVGGFYLYPVITTDCAQDYEYHQEYEYHIKNIDGEFKITVFNCGVNFFGLTQSKQNNKIFEGNPSQFAKFCSTKELA